MRSTDRPTAVGRQLGDRLGGHREIGVDVIQQLVAAAVGERLRIQAGEVRPPQQVVIIGQIPQEVDLLEGRAEALGAKVVQLKKLSEGALLKIDGASSSFWKATTPGGGLGLFLVVNVARTLGGSVSAARIRMRRLAVANVASTASRCAPLVAGEMLSRSSHAASMAASRSPISGIRQLASCARFQTATCGCSAQG